MPSSHLIHGCPLLLLPPIPPSVRVFSNESTLRTTQHSKKWRSWLQSRHFMANRWGNNGNSDRVYFLGPHITADFYFRHEINWCLLLGRKAMTKLDSTLRDITNKGLYSQSYGFPVVTHGYESWTKHRRFDAFELWCWRSLLRVPLPARKLNQSSYRKSVLNIHWKDWCWSSNTFAIWFQEPTH